MKLQYEARAHGHTTKINFLKTSLDELWTKNEMGVERIRTLLHTQGQVHVADEGTIAQGMGRLD